MSTFNGIVAEFPDIRVDYFRTIQGQPHPLACFLSHVHSDHLVGLDTFRSTFVYCSPATRELLLRIERYPHRINFQKGTLEARKQHYKGLQTFLKPIPLQTPTIIELAPGKEIQVTLFDANHCTGAVMFLIEGGGHAILYTGDIRSEPWFVNDLRRNPFLIEYTCGLKKLDTIYIDTTFLEDCPFPSKAEGLQELLRKVSQYPSQTTFHFSAWTFGYEEVWMALSKALNSPIHVDAYTLRLYDSLRVTSGDEKTPRDTFLAPEAPFLAGFRCANNQQRGCLTLDNTVRLHSCEKGSGCPRLDADTVWIQPIIARNTDGSEICEAGVGGGGGDLLQRAELEVPSKETIRLVLEISKNTDKVVLNQVKDVLDAKGRLPREILSLDNMGLDRELDELSIDFLASVLVGVFANDAKKKAEQASLQQGQMPSPRIITFPYSRHSSLAELKDLVRLLNPKDIYPCTIVEDTWSMTMSMRVLFGQHCSSDIFRHDEEMLTRFPHLRLESKIESVPTIKDVSNKGTPMEDVTHSPSLVFGNKTPRREVNFSSLESSPSKRARLGNYHQPAASLSTSAETSESQKGRSEPNEIEDSTEPEFAYYDVIDNVYRCVVCGWEMWRSSGTCTGCHRGTEPYFEHIEPLAVDEDTGADTDAVIDRYPGIVPNEEYSDDDVDSTQRLSLVGDYMDGISAYSSSEESDDVSEANSFVVYGSVGDPSTEEEQSETNESEDNYTFHGCLPGLIRELDELLGRENQDSSSEIVGSRQESFADANCDDGTRTDSELNPHFYGVSSADTDTRHCEVAENIEPGTCHSPSAPGKLDSQVASYGEQELYDSEGDGGQLDFEPPDWHGVELMSTGNNHNEMEIEL